MYMVIVVRKLNILQTGSIVLICTDLSEYLYSACFWKMSVEFLAGAREPVSYSRVPEFRKVPIARDMVIVKR